MNALNSHLMVLALISFFVNFSWVLGQTDLVWHSVGPGGCGWFTTVAVDTLNPGTVFVGSDVGGVYKSTDYGQSWRIVNNGLTDYYVEKIAIDPRNSGVIYLGTWGGVHKSTDYGETWQMKRNGFPNPSLYNYTAPIGALAIDQQNPAIVYAGIGMPRIGHTDISRWQPVPTKGAIFKSTDAGESWRMIRNTGIDTTALLYSIVIHPTNSNTLYAVAHLGVYKSTDGGETWTLKNNGLPTFNDSTFPRGIAINPANPSQLFLTIWSDTIPTWRGGVWQTSNGGELWSPCTTGLHRSKYIDIVINPTVLYTGAVYYGAGGVYKTTNQGQTWSRITTSLNVERGWVRFYGTPQPYGLTMNQADTAMLFYTSAEAVCRTTNAGLNWQQCYTESIGPDDNWKSRGLEVTCIRHIAVDPIDSNRIYVGLADGGTWKSTDRGYSFKWIHDTLQRYGNTNFFIAIHPESSNILYAGTGPWHIDSGLIWRSTDAGENWTLLSSGLPIGAIGPILIDLTNPRIIYAWINRYGVYKTTDGGMTWVLKNNGLAITQGSDSFVQANPQIMVMDKQNPLTLYLCIYQRGKVYKTTNGGNLWFPLNLPANGLEPRGIAIDPLNSNKLYLWTRRWDANLITINNVYRSTDGGTTWETSPIFETRSYQEQIRTFQVSPFDSNLIVLGMTNYAYHDSSTGKGIFISTNGGATWQQANNGLSCWRTYFLTFDPHNPNIIWLGTSGNGVFRGELKKPPSISGWQKKTDLPIGPKNKKVKAGGCLVFADSAIYALKGNNTLEFYRYSIKQNTWSPCCWIPDGVNKKRVKEGGSLCYDSTGIIYAIKGGNTLEFWAYDIKNNSWLPKRDLPLGSGKKIKGGAGLVYAQKGDSSLVFCLKGNKTREFYAYYVQGDTWLKRKEAPLGLSQKGYDKGSCLTYDGENTIYLLKAKYNEFYAYYITGDSWQTKQPMPIQTALGKKKVKDGGSITFHSSGIIYAFKGGNTQEFWSYSVALDTWILPDTIPKGPSNKKVKGGGALCTASNSIYALKGNNTLEFWQYTLMGIKQALYVTNHQLSPKSPILYQNYPNPFKTQTIIKFFLPKESKVNLSIYDATGRLIKNLINEPKEPGEYMLEWCGEDRQGKKVNPGVYFYTLKIDDKVLKKKTVILK
ncbi:MAG: T9SS type A sorting domain-containing protein [candidate division WOR-3 bacterium]